MKDEERKMSVSRDGTVAKEKIEVGIKTGKQTARTNTHQTRLRVISHSQSLTSLCVMLYRAEKPSLATAMSV